ncbi:GMP synthase [glutamine-hydrolyzing] [archaeon HR04]|nr:GMP synthase [glutamine-hydrolyzing] [archaeon HR04]
MHRVLAVQNAVCEHLGTLKHMFEHDGFSIDTVIAVKEQLPDTLEGYDALIVLGGPASAYDDLAYLRREEMLIQDALRHDLPMLGICLGSQLLAKVAGARVYKGHVKEIGWYTVSITEHGLRSIFRGLDDNILVFHWHNDTYDLASSAVRLAYSNNYPNQAFILGNAIGIQFHVEVDEQMVEEWAEEYRNEVQDAGISIDALMHEIRHRTGMLEHTANILYRNFRSMISLYKNTGK